jgi:hypothetical protein
MEALRNIINVEALRSLLTRVRGGGGDATAPGPRIKGQHTKEEDPYALVNQHPLVVTARRLIRRKGFQRWLTLVAMCLGFLAQYALVLIPTGMCNGCAGGAFFGCAFAFTFLVYTGANSVYAPGPWARHLAGGALVAVIPAAYTGASVGRCRCRLTPYVHRTHRARFHQHQRLNPKYDEQLSQFAFKCNLRRYTWVVVSSELSTARLRYGVDGGGLAPSEGQGLTLVHYSAQRKHILWDKLGA